MLASSLLSALLLPVIALAAPTPASELTSRAVVSTKLCASVDLGHLTVTVPVTTALIGALGVTIGQSTANTAVDLSSLGLGTVCLCETNGVLEQNAAIVAVHTTVSSSGIVGNLLGSVLNLVSTTASVLSSVTSAIDVAGYNGILSATQGGSCSASYPTDASTFTPSSSCSAPCSFTCNTGRVLSTSSNTCVLSASMRKRRNGVIEPPAWLKTRQAVIQPIAGGRAVRPRAAPRRNDKPAPLE